MTAIGLDTSNYTTSIAYFNGDCGANYSKLLPVKEGALGLRQSDAVFHHTQSLPELSGRLFSNVQAEDIRVIGVSTKPRAVEGSYMPCFTVGYSHACLLAEALHVPLRHFSHQQGHVAASAWSSGHMELLETPHIAWHLSGGTTELLLVEPNKKSVHCQKIGGTTDISAGQLIDRTGQLLGLQFPAGKAIDALSKQATRTDFFRVKCTDLNFSLSGVENKVMQYQAAHNNNAETAAYVLRCIIQTIITVSQNALKRFPELPLVLSGGVASNSMLRTMLMPLNPIFAQPEYATDNAMGIAVLAHRSLEG